ncbi:MAG: hypothetical protein ACRCRZ_01190 [Metamycoplasmataceae bacterium]
MKHLKKISFFAGVSCLALFSIPFIQATSQLTLNNDSLIDNSVEVVDIKKLNYFYQNTNKLKNEKKEIKKMLDKIIEDYSLKEWNDYYSKNNYNSKIWTLTGKDYDLTKDLPKNSTYDKQDEQFKYFEDFIFTVNPLQIVEGNNYVNKKDSFLFRRYQFIAINRAIEYAESDISKITKSDWKEAIEDLKPPPPPLPPVPNPTKLFIIFEKIISYFSKSSFFKPHLAAADLLLRIKDKDYDEYQKSNIKKWAKEIWELEKEWNISKIIMDTVTRDTPNSGPGNDEIPEELSEFLQEIIDKFLEPLISTMSKNNVEEQDFYNKIN